MSTLSNIKDIILTTLEDGEEHSSEELKKRILLKGIKLDQKSSAFRTAIYQLRNSGVNIESSERGIYALKKEKLDIGILDGFSVLRPEEKKSQRYVYVHDDGKIILNGKLNNDIQSRNIEIRLKDDGEKIALIIDGSNCHRFTKNGHTINREFVKILGRKKVKFPLSYEMEQINHIWIGKLKRTEIKKQK